MEVRAVLNIAYLPLLARRIFLKIGMAFAAQRLDGLNIRALRPIPGATAEVVIER